LTDGFDFPILVSLNSNQDILEVLMSVDMSNNSALRPFFAPKGIAVVGARSTPGLVMGFHFDSRTMVGVTVPVWLRD
jgi:hypothetical protein